MAVLRGSGRHLLRFCGERFGICLHLRISLLIELHLLVLTIVGLPVIIDSFVALLGAVF